MTKKGKYAVYISKATVFTNFLLFQNSVKPCTIIKLYAIIAPQCSLAEQYEKAHNFPPYHSKRGVSFFEIRLFCRF